MNNFRRLISIVLSVILVFSTVTVLSYAEEAEKVYGEESVGILNVLGITKLTKNELSGSIKRADFLKMMSIASGYGASHKSEQLFADLSFEDEREPYVRALYDVKAITVDAAGKIYPDAEIGMAEAVALAVKLAGYSPVAETKGGYPTGYMNVAKQKEILDKLPTNPYTVLTNGMALQLVENTLKADLMVQTSFGEESGYEEKPGVNFLGTIFGVKHIEDVLAGVDISRIIGENDVPSEFIEVGGVTLEVRGLEIILEDLYTYLGYRVNVYYTENRGDIAKAIYLEKSLKNSEKVFDLDDVEVTSAGRIKVYDEKGRSKAYSFRANLPVIYNGISTKQRFSNALISGKSGTMTLIDNTGEGAADIILLDIYESFVVGQVDQNKNIIYDKYDNKNTLKVDLTTENPYTVIYNEIGEQIDINGIADDSVLAIFKASPDSAQGFINIYVVANTVEGEISRLKDNGKIIVIDDVEYEITDKCRAKHGYLFKAGQSVALKLDYSGKVIWASVGEAAKYVYGFLSAIDTGEGLAGDIKMKIFAQTGEFVIISVANKVKIDGQTYQTSDAERILQIFNAASGEMFNQKASDGTVTKAVPGNCYASPIRYLVGSKGEITSVDTILKSGTNMKSKRSDILNPGDEMFTYYDGAAVCRTPNRTLGPKVGYNTDTIVIMHPNPLADSYNELDNLDNYGTRIGGSYFTVDTSYSVTACYTDPSSFRSNVIFMGFKEGGGTIPSGTAISVVNDVYEVYDEETGDISAAVEIITWDKKTEYLVKDKNKPIVNAAELPEYGLSAAMTVMDNPETENIVEGLIQGDVIAYTTDSRGYLEVVQLYYRMRDNIYVNGVGMTTQMMSYELSGNSHRLAFVYDKVEDGFLFYYVGGGKDMNDKSVLKTVGAEDCFLAIGGNPAYYIYEEARPGEYDIRLGSLDDVKTYVDTGEDCSRVYIQQGYRLPLAILVF